MDVDKDVLDFYWNINMKRKAYVSFTLVNVFQAVGLQEKLEKIKGSSKVSTRPATAATSIPSTQSQLSKYQMDIGSPQKVIPKQFDFQNVTSPKSTTLSSTTQAIHPFTPSQHPRSHSSNRISTAVGETRQLLQSYS